MVRKEEGNRGSRPLSPSSPPEQPGRYIGGIFQIYYPLICYIGEREREREERAPLFLCWYYIFLLASVPRGGPPLPHMFTVLTACYIASSLFRHSLKEGQTRDFQNASLVHTASLALPHIFVGRGDRRLVNLRAPEFSIVR